MTCINCGLTQIWWLHKQNLLLQQAFYCSGSCLTKIHGDAHEINVCLCVCVKKVKILVPPIPSFNYSIVHKYIWTFPSNHYHKDLPFTGKRRCLLTLRLFFATCATSRTINAQQCLVMNMGNHPETTLTCISSKTSQNKGL